MDHSTALYWIQMLTMLEVPVPIKILLPMLEQAMQTLMRANDSTDPYAAVKKVITDANVKQPEKHVGPTILSKVRRGVEINVNKEQVQYTISKIQSNRRFTSISHLPLRTRLKSTVTS